MANNVKYLPVNIVEKKKRGRGDLLLLFSVLLLSVTGLIAVYSASRYNAESTYGDAFYMARKHMTGLFIGYSAMIFSSVFNCEKYKKISIWLLIGSLVLLVLVFTPLGFENYGAKRWIKIAGITIQPSELAKICYVLFVASYLDKDPSRTKRLSGILPIIIMGGIICLLVILEPNMSITVCFGVLMLLLLFVSGTKMKWIMLVIVPVIALIPLLIIAEPYRLNRLSAFLNPWASPKGEGYQLLQSLYALGSGGFFGVGIFNSRQKFRFLPFSESDFILAVIGEECGFIGLFLLFLLIVFIVWRGVRTAMKCKTFYGYMVAMGVSGIFGIQSLINALVVTGSIPPTGLPLPLVSAGNTSLIVFLFSFGVVYNISRSQL